MAALLALSAFLTSAAAQVRKPFSFDDFGKVAYVGEAEISPDGQRVVYSVMRTDMKNDSSTSQLMLFNLATGDQRPLTPERKTAGSATWSPDGKWLAFVSTKMGDPTAKPQIYVLPMDGGEAQAVTNAPNGVGSYAWRPDGKAFAYTMAETASNEAEIKKHHDLFIVGDQDYLSQAAPVATQIWLQVIGDGKAKRLTSGNRSVTGGVSWSGDGRFLAFSHLPDRYFGHDGHIHAAILEVATGKVTDLTQGNTYSTGPTFAPGSDELLYTIGRENLWSFQNRLMVTSATDLASRKLVADNVDRNISGSWTPQGDIYVSAQDGTRMGLWRVAAGSTVAEPVHLVDDDLSVESVAKDGTIAGVESSVANPGELVVIAAGSHTVRRLTNVNAWLSGYDLARSEEFTWTNEGFAEDGVLTYPLGYVPGHKYPVILDIHGGPTGGGSGLGFSEFHQVLAARGYFVFEPNYRGSGNLSFAYAKAWLGDPVAGAGRDVVAGVKALEATGMIDPNRIGVSGWSAGGWMTSWLITHYHIWRAAVSGAAVDNAIEEYALNDVYDYLPSLLNGLTPWSPHGQAVYLAVSPIMFVQNVTTPTLILSDTGDYRVPTPQSYEFYHALKDLGKTVEFIAIPAYGHFPSDPVRARETDKAWAAWMDRYLK